MCCVCVFFSFCYRCCCCWSYESLMAGAFVGHYAVGYWLLKEAFGWSKTASLESSHFSGECRVVGKKLLGNEFLLGIYWLPMSNKWVVWQSWVIVLLSVLICIFDLLYIYWIEVFFNLFNFWQVIWLLWLCICYPLHLSLAMQKSTILNASHNWTSCQYLLLKQQTNSEICNYFC